MLFLCLKEERSYDRIPNFTVSYCRNSQSLCELAGQLMLMSAL
jgi:hypothetical protein